LLLGTALAGSGAEVLYWGRPAVLEPIRQGFTLRTRRHAQAIGPLQVAYTLEEAARAGPFDWTLLAFKSFHNAEALAHARQVPSRRWLVVQNGLGSEEAFIAAGLRVAVGALTCSVHWPMPGVLQAGYGGLGLAPSSDVGDLAVAFRSGGMTVRTYPDGSAMKGSKWLLNLMGNPLAAALEMPPSAYLATHAGIMLEKTLQQEAFLLLRALGLPLVDLPGFPVRFLRLLPLFPGFVWRALLVQGRGGKLPSLLLDRQARRPLEREAMLARPLAMAEAHGLSLPLLSLLDQALGGEGALARDFSGRPAALWEAYRKATR
jgi:2-dehydropantoate 2-reductase